MTEKVFLLKGSKRLSTKGGGDGDDGNIETSSIVKNLHNDIWHIGARGCR